jgi:hypothetical protein
MGAYFKFLLSVHADQLLFIQMDTSPSISLGLHGQMPRSLRQL